MAERNTRFNSNGQVFISQVSNTDALLKNLSDSGLCIESSDVIEVLPKTRYSIDIIPEKESKVEAFSLEIESRWVKAKMKTSESGFVIVVPPDTSVKAMLEQYLHYLSSQPNAEQEENDEEHQTPGSLDISKEDQ